MSRELYFLRSSEQKIVTDMFKHAHPTKEDELLKYTEFYGLTPKDLGLYALVSGEIAGAIWSRKFEGDVGATLSVAIVPKFKDEGIESFMIEQFLEEAAAVFDELSIDISAQAESKELYETFGFTPTKNDFVLSKTLERKDVIRPSDGYDPKKWMD